ncbi:WD40 repeat domain-containing serine/threonine protein kinase [Streptomyces sp. NPDC021020]|uniref:WD40 repeat domain-containing serine/threonine protein kinase n=1 Tax=Streptomyces sp. NPDC021020 TaxID=3365109 RepID=UPI00378E664B
MGGVEGFVAGGRYRLLESVGRGGMGRVWRGHDETLDRQVAVKEVLLPEGVTAAERAELLVRMLREARLAARLQHPGIVTVHDVVEDGGTPWIVMEFVAGRSLGALLGDEGRLPWERAAAVGADIAEALAHAHAAGVVHRDLKPDNVLIAGRRCVLTDFGIARVLDSTTKLTRTNALIGTPQFMAPEQIEGTTITTAADLWSLGALLYTAVEGRPPFDAPGLMPLFHAILSTPLPAPSHAGPLSGLLGRLMEKDPAARPSAVETAELLRGALGPGAAPAPVPRQGPARAPVPTVVEPAAAPPPPPRPPAARPVDHLPTRPATASPPLPARLPAPLVTLRPVPRTSWRETLPGGVTGPVSLSTALSATAVAFDAKGRQLATGHDSGVVQVWNVKRLTLVERFTFSESAHLHKVGFSDDGKSVFAGGSSGARQWRIRNGDVSNLFVANLLDGTEGEMHDVLRAYDMDVYAAAGKDGVGTMNVAGMVMLALVSAITKETHELPKELEDRMTPGFLKVEGESAYGLAMSADCALLAVATRSPRVQVWNRVGRTLTATLTTGDGTPVTAVALSPDGTKLAGCAERDAVYVWDVPSRRLDLVLGPGHGPTTGRDIAFSPDGAWLAVTGDYGVRLFNTQTGGPTAALGTPGIPAAAFAFSPDAKRLAVAQRGAPLTVLPLPPG